jgi:hypothetical protein
LEDLGSVLQSFVNLFTRSTGEVVGTWIAERKIRLVSLSVRETNINPS